MKTIIIYSVLLVSLVNSTAHGEINNYILTPSNKLLELVDITDYEITDKINIQTGTQNKTCDNPWQLPLKALGRIENVHRVIVAIENTKTKKAKSLFEIKNMGGLPITDGFFSVRISIPEYNDGKISNIWIFMETTKGIFASATQVTCSVVQ